jgi:hypothetical protein
MTGNNGPGQRNPRMAPAGLRLPIGDHEVQDGKCAGKQFAPAQSAPMARQPRVGIWRSVRCLTGAMRPGRAWLANAKPRACRSAVAAWRTTVSVDAVLNSDGTGFAGER